MDIRDLDLNLLLALDAMIRHRSVTRAAEAIGLSQPAMSAALGRLRQALGDPLFVRAGNEMQPTPRGLELAEPVQRIMNTLRNEVLQRSGFEPAYTERLFTIITPDIGEVNFLPRLLQRLRREAPHARLRAISQPRQAAAEALESGAADLALGYFPDLHRPCFFQQKLFDNRHVCLLRADHPVAGQRLTLKRYLELSHAVVRPDGREHVFEQFLQQQGLQRHVLLEVSHFMSLLPLIETTDLIATVPHDLAALCMNYGRLLTREVPLKTPTIPVHQFWHRRYHRDPGHQWLRQLVADTLGWAAQDDASNTALTVSPQHRHLKRP